MIVGFCNRIIFFSEVAQLVEQSAVNRSVVGSSPTIQEPLLEKYSSG